MAYRRINVWISEHFESIYEVEEFGFLAATLFERQNTLAQVCEAGEFVGAVDWSIAELIERNLDLRSRAK